MHLSYTVAEADLMAYAAYHYDHSPAIRRRMTTGRIVLVVVALLFALIAVLLWASPRCMQLSSATRGLLIAAIALAVIVTAVYVFHRRMFLWGWKRTLRAPKNQAVLGPQSMEISDEGLTVTRATGQRTTYWKSVSRVEVAAEAAYIFITSNEAYIVPKSSVTEGDFDSFVAELGRRISAAAQPSH